MGEQDWFRHYPAEVPHSLVYPDIPVTRLLEDTARAYPGTVATVFFGARRTYRETWLEARRFARALVGLGITPGDRVALMLPNCPQAVSAYYGALLAGAVIVWVNPLYTVRELVHQLADSGAKAIVALDLVYPKVARAWPETVLERAVITSVRDRLPFPLRQLYPMKERLPQIPYGPTVLRYDATLEGGPGEDGPLPGESRRGDDLALLQYTGGTTGLAKGAMLTHANLIANVVQARAWLHRMPEGGATVLAALPFFHVYGLTTVLHYAVGQAATMVLLPRPDGPGMVRAIERHRVRVFPGTPTMYVAINRIPGIERRDLRSVEACISGSAPLPMEVQERFERLTGGRLVEGYGLTEASPVTHANPVWEDRRPGTIGLPWPDTDARVVDPDTGRDVPAGEVGELWVRGPQVMMGYWNQPEETAAVLVDGWLRTGDLATVDTEGYFRIVDRKKDVIIAGGYNIYPREVEEVLYRMPQVEEAVVVGVPDEYRGETVKAFIKLKPGASLAAAEVDAFCRKELAAYKVPRFVAFRDELPKSAVGKLLRRTLLEEERARAATGGGSPAGPDSAGRAPVESAPE